MTPRENVLSLYRRQGYEHAPVALSLCPSLERKFKELSGGEVPIGEFLGYPEGFCLEGVAGPRLPEREPVDWARYFEGGLAEKTWVDEWGIAHEPGSEAAMHMTRMRHPMERFDSLEQMQAYPFPDYENAATDHMAADIERVHERGLAAVAGMACTVWETSWYIRGMPQIMMDMVTDNPMASWLLDKVTSSACARAAAHARAGCDVLALGDDIGMQSRMLMAPEMWREWLKPRLAKVIASARAVKPDVIVHYHSCGFVIPVIEDFIEIGIDVLNPVQPECMDFAELHAEFGERLSFDGTLGTQTTMPFGTPAEVREVVLRNLGIAGSKGGLLVSPTHLLEPEVPWENIAAYVAACREFKAAGPAG